jgi:hypothetical protein
MFALLVTRLCKLALLTLGLIWGVVPGGPGPQNPGLERPDAARRGRVDPAHPPAGYYETAERRHRLRGSVRRALGAARSALGKRRSN